MYNIGYTKIYIFLYLNKYFKISCIEVFVLYFTKDQINSQYVEEMQKIRKPLDIGFGKIKM